MEEWKELLRSGKTWEFNRWREEHPELYLDLRGEDLSRTNLDSVYLVNCNLKSADFSHASLIGAFFCKSNLSCCDFTNANLEGAQFGPSPIDSERAFLSPLRIHLKEGSILRRANFKNANVMAANFRKSDMAEADFSICSSVSKANFDGANMQRMKTFVPWFSQYLETLDRTSLINRLNDCVKGKVMSKDDIEFWTCI
eukprot:TRINITY_DN7618_c0_g1_i1.p1 TRINITY_DN7618_c0_g1~~TRINITY_DN7618_c0_g1_i1.p1  ORF type:complete len:198 (-),score=41.69 TRINITY_DN7618_c0_g1_i1:63-656(-)